MSKRILPDFVYEIGVFPLGDAFLLTIPINHIVRYTTIGYKKDQDHPTVSTVAHRDYGCSAEYYN